MVTVRNTLEKMYEGTCTVTEYQAFQRPDFSTGQKEVDVLKDQPCKLSYASSPKAKDSRTSSTVTQEVKVFIAPEIDVKAGSKLTITQNGVKTEYQNSGEPAVYSTHQEINLELFEGWT